MALRRPIPFEEIVYVPAPTGGWNPDANTWELPPNQAPVLDNALIRPGRIAVRGGLTNWADLSTITVPASPLNVAGVQPLPGTPKLAIGRKAVSATAFVDPWFAPIVRPAAAAALAAPTADMAVAVGGATFSNTATAANLIPGPRGISFEGTRYYIGYGTLTAPVADSGGTFFAQTTNLCTINGAGTVAAMTNAPRGFIDIKGYQSRIWGIGGIDDPGGGTTFNPLALFFTNPIGPGGGNTAAFADWKDPVFGTTNKIVMDGDTTDPGVGLAVVRNGLVVFRKQSIWLLRGTTMASYTLVPVTRQVGCVDPRSIVETDRGVYFMSAQGLMLSDGVSIQNLSGAVMYTLQNALTVVTAAISSSFGGYITCTVTSSGQLVVSMGIASVTAGAPDGHIQPVWSGMFDPASSTWTRITSLLFASDGTIITAGNNYPGQVFNTPDQRVLSIGDKYITQWESVASSNVPATLPAGPQNPTSVVADTSSGVGVWSNLTNAKVVDGVYASAGIAVQSPESYAAAVAQTSTPGAVSWNVINNMIGSPDGVLSALSLVGGGAVSQFVALNGYGFSIPTDATILGIQVQISGYQGTGSNVIHNLVQLEKAGVLVGSNLGGQSLPVSTEGINNYGGPTSLWGTTWTPADINTFGFGLGVQALSPSGPGSNFAFIDAVGIIIWYAQGTQILKATSYGFSIPSTATISGIQVGVTRRSTVGTVVDRLVQLYKAGALIGTDHSAVGVWGTSVSTVSYGGSSDLWGTTWTPADVNNTGFGAALAAKLNSNPGAGSGYIDTAQVDAIVITVYYTVASVTHQQSFVKVPALYDTDAAGNFQPIPFRWVAQLFPFIGTSTGRRRVIQMKRFFFDYVFQGIGLPSANGFTVRPVDSAGNIITGAVSVQLPPTNNSMTNSSITGGQPNATTAIERSSTDLFSEASDMAFDVTWTDAQQSSAPSYVAAEIYGVGVQWLPGRDLR